MTTDFSNKVALITGSGRGIGATTAIHLASLGADVVINFFRNRASAEETAKAVEALGRKALIVKADVATLTTSRVCLMKPSRHLVGWIFW